MQSSGELSTTAARSLQAGTTGSMPEAAGSTTTSASTGHAAHDDRTHKSKDDTADVHGENKAEYPDGGDSAVNDKKSKAKRTRLPPLTPGTPRTGGAWVKRREILETEAERSRRAKEKSGRGKGGDGGVSGRGTESLGLGIEPPVLVFRDSPSCIPLSAMVTLKNK